MRVTAFFTLLAAAFVGAAARRSTPACFVVSKTGARAAASKSALDTPRAPVETVVGRSKVMTFLDPSGGPGRPKRETEGDFFKSEFEDMSAAEKFADPQVILGLFAVFFPFGLLGVAFAAGWVGQ
mmetsp:Transcript_11741/g.24738  ORF Transcript_11741/g.24738 Transcript_11741/m.24738 type:complete len:125 (-) Transcript_11741:464-838(-)